MSQGPLFDSTRAALEFALNADRVEMPRPVMTRAMAEPDAPLTKHAAKRQRKAEAILSDADGNHVSLTREKGFAPVVIRPKLPTSAEEKAGQAGMILATLQRLDREHVAVLTARCARRADPCPCQRPCCSGWMPNPRWRAAIAETCEILRDRAELIKKPGVKGLGTHPGLREAIVGGYFSGRRLTLERLAEGASISLTTAASHRGLIDAWLEQTETDAWADADLVFSNAGIVGAPEDPAI